MNKKGFSLVEILVVITILGILMGVGIPLVSRYVTKAREQSYSTMISTLYSSSKNYIMDKGLDIFIINAGPHEALYIKANELYDDSYIERLTDPASQTNTCTGWVRVRQKSTGGLGTLSDRVYAVRLNCSKYSDTKCFDDNSKTVSCTADDKKTPEGEEGGSDPRTASATITLNRGVGTGGTSKLYSINGESEVYIDSDCTAEANYINIPTSTTHTFKGYYKVNNASSPGAQYVDASGAVTLDGKNAAASYTANTTWYAMWEPIKYTLTYNNQGGSGCTNKTVNAGSAWGTLCTPVLAEKSFQGWYTAANGGGTKITDTTVPTANVTAHAKWISVTYTLTYDSQGGSSCSAQTATSGTNWGTLCSPTKTNYNFSGWYTETNGGGTNVTSTSLATANTKVYAKWTIKTYKLTYNNEGGTGCTSKTTNAGSSWGTLCTPTMAGKTFAGWYTAANGGGTQVTASTVPTANTTVHAKWQTVNYTLTYNNEGGSGCSSQTVVSGSTWGTLCTPTRTNYTFGGWFTGTNGSGTRIYATTVATANTTVHAKWTIKTYTLTYDNQSGSGCTSKTVNAGSSWGTLCAPTRAAHTFQGWYTSTNGGGTKITASTVPTANKVVYAYWTAKTITSQDIISSHRCANETKGSDYIFTYTGYCKVVQESTANWKVYLYGNSTSHRYGSDTLTFVADMNLDVFVVGGGGGSGLRWGGGGGGGYTKYYPYSTLTSSFGQVRANTNYTVYVGDGGTGGCSAYGTKCDNGKATDGQKSYIFSTSIGANGGEGGYCGNTGAYFGSGQGTCRAGQNDAVWGGSGGSGGGPGWTDWYCDGGESGGNHNGIYIGATLGKGATGSSGQGYSTCEWATSSNAAGTCPSSIRYSAGGHGGCQHDYGDLYAGAAGAENSGNGGSAHPYYSYDGGSGVVIFRNKR